MRRANWSSLEEKIIRPGMERFLVPLLMYRGTQNIGRIHRLWNFAITCMEHEVENYSQAVKLSHNPDFAHLCGPHRPIQTFSLYGLFGRLIDKPEVTNNIPRFTEYVRDIRGAKFTPVKVYQHIKNFESGHVGRYAPWRIVRVKTSEPDGTEVKAGDESVFVEGGHYEITIAQIINNPAWRDLGLLRPKRSVAPVKKRAAQSARAPSVKADTFYPYMVHDPSVADEGRRLVLAVNSIVPQSLPDFIRADICQDIVVSVLAGEIALADISPGGAKQFISKVLKDHPIKYGPLSLDAPAYPGGPPLHEIVEGAHVQ
jgi:hypothetical protein